MPLIFGDRYHHGWHGDLTAAVGEDLSRKYFQITFNVQVEIVLVKLETSNLICVDSTYKIN